MALGEFTTEAAKECGKALSEMFDALPKGKRALFLGHLNEIGVFLVRASTAAHLLDGIRQYYLDTCPGKEVPFVRAINKLMPRLPEKPADPAASPSE